MDWLAQANGDKKGPRSDSTRLLGRTRLFGLSGRSPGTIETLPLMRTLEMEGGPGTCCEEGGTFYAELFTQNGF